MSLLQKLRNNSGTAAPSKPMAAEDSDLSASSAEAAAVIRASLLFDEAWYCQQYGFGEYLDGARHYLTTGWREGKDPSLFFHTEEYLEMYPDVRRAGINPLLHFEQYGFAEGRYRQPLQARRAGIAAANPACCGSMEGGLLRIRITNACNAKCRYCGVRLGFGKEKEHAMDPAWYYELCRPLYNQVNMVLITGGDAFVALESYNYMKFMSENYPRVTLMTESNGIAFSERFQRLAAENLFKTHFSVNSSTAAYFAKSCWEGEGGEAVYPKLRRNIADYVESLRREDKLCFAPSLSMVINHDNTEDVQDFIRMALEHHAWYICFYFDYTENNMSGDYFHQPELMRPVLRQLMEIERVLAGRVLVYFRLWIPFKEAAPLQQEVEAEPLENLRQKYHDLLERSEGRSVEGEYRERNAWRRRLGKQELSLAEDFAPSVRLAAHCGKELCFAPWGEIDLYPDGRMDFCSWFEPTLNLHDFIRDGHVDWEEVVNSYAYMAARKRILAGNYRGCQVCCPMNDVKNEVASVHHYGAERLQAGRKG